MQKKYDNAVQVVFKLEKPSADQLKRNIKRYTDYQSTTEFLQQVVKEFNNSFFKGTAMRLNQTEMYAITIMMNLLEAIRNGENYYMSQAGANAIYNVLGIDIFKERSLTYKKKIDKFVQGKDDFHLEIHYGFSPSHEANWIQKHYYFPFQIKERNE